MKTQQYDRATQIELEDLRVMRDDWQVYPSPEGEGLLCLGCGADLANWRETFGDEPCCPSQVKDEGEKEVRMNSEEHKARHQLLHKELDELIADYLQNTSGRVLSGRTSLYNSICDLMTWSYEQTINPTDEEGG